MKIIPKKGNSTLWIILAIALVAAGVFFFFTFTQDGNIENGGGNNGNGNGNGDEQSVVYKDIIRVEEPLPDSTISSPLTIRGEARGQWYFEATFPIVLTDWDGRIIAEGYVEAQDEWMTVEYVPFEGTLTFNADTSVSNRGSLILQKANASGLPEHDDAFEYTVFFEE
jgi:hypothetical protein